MQELLTAQLAALGAAPDDNREALSLLASRRAEICCMVLDLAQCGELAEDAAARSACVAALDPALDEQMSAAQLQQVRLNPKTPIPKCASASPCLVPWHWEDHQDDPPAPSLLAERCGSSTDRWQTRRSAPTRRPAM